MARCEKCQLMRINGVIVHERGCPDAYKHEIRECKWCGQDFEPESNDQRFCDGSCFHAYNGMPSEEDCEIDPDEEFEFDQLEEDERLYQQELSRQLQKQR